MTSTWWLILPTPCTVWHCLPMGSLWGHMTTAYRIIVFNMLIMIVVNNIHIKFYTSSHAFMREGVARFCLKYFLSLKHSVMSFLISFIYICPHLSVAETCRAISFTLSIHSRLPVESIPWVEVFHTTVVKLNIINDKFLLRDLPRQTYQYILQYKRKLGCSVVSFDHSDL